MSVIAGTPHRFDKKGVVVKGYGNLIGFLCNNAAGSRMSVYDGVDESGVPFVDGLRLIAGQYMPLPANFTTGLYVTLDGEADVTFFIDG